MPIRIPFNKPYATGKEFENLSEAIASLQLAGDGKFTRLCQNWLTRQTGAKKALLTHSCTGALEMCAILLDIRPGDEVIVPSYTFVSTANAFVLRGAVPVFVDIRPDTLNIDERKIEEAITPRTRAICVVHYAGVGCEMDEILAIGARHRLPIVEDDAQGMMATYKGRALGSFGVLAAVSYHETKNVISGEGGALLVNDSRLVDRAEIVWQKGTNRQAFFRGEVDKYSWVDLGSSFLASEITAAFLWAQVEQAEAITRRRLEIWNRYYTGFADLEARGLVRRPVVPAECLHNGHLFYLLTPDPAARTRLLAGLREKGIHGIFHYVPLHSSPAGMRYGRVPGTMSITDSVSERLVRLPMWVGLTNPEVDEVIETVHAVTSGTGA